MGQRLLHHEGGSRAPARIKAGRGEGTGVPIKQRNDRKGVGDACLSRRHTVTLKAPSAGNINHAPHTELRTLPPCPPSGRHRYRISLYAIDKVLNLPRGETREDLATASGDNILARGQIIGLYSHSSSE